MPTPRRSTQRRSRRRGAAAAELAVCLPLIILLVLATIEACTMIYLKQSLTVAAYEGARTALTPGATSADVTTQATQVLTDRDVQGGSVALTPLVFETAATGSYLRVQATAPCDMNGGLGSWFYQGKSLTGTVEVMKEF